MYQRAETSQTRQAFWTAFGQYMAPMRSAEGEKITWLNYKTSEKHIHFKMHAGTKSASIGIELTHADAGLRQLYFEQFEQYKTVLENYVTEPWTWKAQASDENSRSISAIFKECRDVNIMNRNDWPALITFFKPRIIALDAFWCDVKYAFEALR